MKAVIHTLGCKVNSYESEVLSNILEENGYQISEEDGNEIDVCVINTCTVTNIADRKSRKIINQCIRNNKNAIIIALGCYTQMKHDQISNNKDINIILGTNNKTKIIECIKKYKESKKQIIEVNTTRNLSFENMNISSFQNKQRAYVKIQDGCNNFCTYCIIPYSRGTIRCKKFKEVIEEIDTLVNNGYKEIVLTGIHTGSYNDSGKTFIDLLKKIVEINKLERLRISSIEITELNDEFIELLGKSEKIVDHLHIPLQSGCDKILKLMNRKYDTKKFKEIIDKIRKIRPNISLTTDVIVGFPNETDEDFMNTYEFIDKIDFSSLHVFPYSKRDKTVAANMDNQVEEIIKSERVKKLLVLKERKEYEYMSKYVSKELDVLFETKYENKYIGHTGNYIKVCVESSDNLIGMIKKVKITSLDYPMCIGVLISY